MFGDQFGPGDENCSIPELVAWLVWRGIPVIICLALVVVLFLVLFACFDKESREQLISKGDDNA